MASQDGTPDAKRQRHEQPTGSFEVRDANIGQTISTSEEEAGLQEVEDFLSEAGLVQYLQRFAENGFDLMEAVQLMDRHDMLECGMLPEHAVLLQSKLLDAERATVQQAPQEQQAQQAQEDAAQAEQALLAALRVFSVPEGLKPPPQQIAASSYPPSVSSTATSATASTGAFVPAPAESKTLLPENADEITVYNTLYAMAQLAEESAQMAASSAAYVANPGNAEPLQLAAVTEAAQQAAQRAEWAASSIEAAGDQKAKNLDWLPTVRQIARQAADAADLAAESCRSHTAHVARLEDLQPKKSKVPCKFFQAGRCPKGEACEFSHNSADLKPRPLMLKSLKDCIFFAKGHCMRGPACPFAHGDEERKEIQKYVDNLRSEKQCNGKR